MKHAAEQWQGKREEREEGHVKERKKGTVGTSIPSYMPCMSFLAFEAFLY